MYYKDLQNNLHALDSGDFAHMLPVGSVQITDSEAQALRPAPVPPTYRQLRAAAYPAIGEQLDAIWKGGNAAVEMLDAILAVKAKYPKP